MKLATRKTHTRDGELLVVSRDLRRAAAVPQIAPTLQASIEDWVSAEPRLQRVYDALNANECPYALDFDPSLVAAPLPRAYQWLDASAFDNHGQLMITAFGFGPAPGTEHIPLMYQGGSDDFLGARDDITLPREADGIDFEGEIAVVLDDVPLGVGAMDAGRHIRLLMLVNDVSLRTIGPREMATGFGFLQAKPSSSFSPVAVTPDEFGNAWDGERLHLPVRISWNDERFGEPNAREMTFSFPELIAHAAHTRRLRAGTILGSGTVSNSNRAAGSACISERRAIEMIDSGAIQTSFMRFGDRIRMEMFDATGESVFGAIEQVVRSSRPNA